MTSFKQIRKNGFKTMKKHYGRLLILCVIAIFLGVEFSEGALFLHLSGLQIPAETEAEHHMLPNGFVSDPGMEVFKEIASGDITGGIELSNELDEEYKESGSGIMGHSAGVLATLSSSFMSGHLYTRAIQVILTITDSPEVSVIIFVLLALIIYSLFFALIREPFAAAIRFVFMEARTYDKLAAHHIFHLKHTKGWIRASKTIVLKDLFIGLWSLTIVGFFIKRYSYWMVPYIVAENPDVEPLQAINLSRRMMDGHKWECFKYEFSFIGWLVLCYLSAGLLTVFLYAPWKMSSNIEYYVYIRAEAKEKNIQDAELLDDPYLHAKASPEILHEAYGDVNEELELLEKNEIKLEGKQKFFAENLAIWIGGLTKKRDYQNMRNRRFALESSLDAMHGIMYPDRLDKRIREKTLIEKVQVDFLRCYTLPNLFLMFFLFAFIGYVWEVILFLFQTGEFVNRGSLYGPWVPIYGVGGTLILVAVCKLRTKPVLEFFGIMVLCGIVEYFTSLVMEIMFDGMRWWDYSGYLLNLDGRICAEGLFAFAVLGSAVVYYLAPALDSLFMKANQKFLVILTVVLLIFFTCDVIYSGIHPHKGKGITDMGNAPDLLIHQDHFVLAYFITDQLE